jgi:hypothetical protein
MKKLLVLLSFLGFLGFLLTPNSYAYPDHSWPAPPVAVGDTIYFDDGPGSGSGGEFEIYSNPARTDTYHLFNTFCLEIYEYMNYTDAFHVGDITTVAKAGGYGADPNLGGDPLDPMTAYLYQNFYYGTLTGYNYTGSENTVFNSRQDAGTALQVAIWTIEQEYINAPLSQAAVDASTNYYVQLAWNAVNVEGTWTGLGDVRVINLTGSLNKQDQLTVVPEPATMLLFGTGLIGLAGLGRKKFFKKA